MAHAMLGASAMRTNTTNIRHASLRLARRTVLFLLCSACSVAGPPGPAITARAQAIGAAPTFTLFESGHVRPLALSPNGDRLYAVNTPDNRLEIFDVTAGGLQHRDSVSVGLEPVAVAVRDSHEVWVVNHLSDSISVVKVSPSSDARVVRTLLVGDEPRDIVFAGPQRRRAFITTAHRGQNNPIDPQLLTPGIGRADVWVFDSQNLGAGLGGTPLAIVTLFTDTPRALAVTPDGRTVYAAGFQTGNRTTIISELTVPNGGQAAGGLPLPNTNFLGEQQPETGLIVKYDGQHWLDVIGRAWDAVIMFSLPDKDVFAIDAMATPPAQLTGAAGSFAGVGTILFNMIVNPANGHVYVSNTDAQNDKRFEGPGIFAGSSLRGHLHESRITVLANGGVSPRHLNKHIDYTTCCSPLPNAENDASLASPQGMAITDDGATLYVAAFGSGKVGVYQTTQLENDTFVPSTGAQIPVTGGGPSGVVLDEQRHRLYVMTRFDNGISAIDTVTRNEAQHVALFDPEPASVVEGRPLLYDAARTSSHGDSSCSSCHVFGDFDSLAWDLGNPDATSLANPNPQILEPLFPVTDPSYRPLKGPMTTQSLRGMANQGPMHWRGDRTGGNDAANIQPDSGAFDENAAFRKFNPAFESLLGRSTALSAGEMQAFADFALQIVYPPNPVRNLDNSLTERQQEGRDHFMTPNVFLSFSCNDCHKLDPTANAAFGVRFPGLFGGSPFVVRDAGDPLTLPQTIKVPHLRNLYQKVGMFGAPEQSFIGLVAFYGTGYLGDQVRGFGYVHDGSFANVENFLNTLGFSTAFSTNGFQFVPGGDPKAGKVTEFLLAFDSNLAPIVGQQITLTASNGAVAGPRIDLLVARAALGECELVARAKLVAELGFLYSGGQFFPNRQLLPAISAATVRLLPQLPGGEVTYTCVPVGSGRRLALDADLDGYLDGDEDDAGSDPRDPNSTP